jgi:hypothetical protein
MLVEEEEILGREEETRRKGRKLKEEEKERAVKENNKRLIEENEEEIDAARASNITRFQTCVQLCWTDICIRNYIFDKYGECPQSYKERADRDRGA